MPEPTVEVIIKDGTMELREIKRPPGQSALRASDELRRAEAIVKPQEIHPRMMLHYKCFDYDTGAGHYLTLSLPLGVQIHTASLEEEPEAELSSALERLENQLRRSLELLQERRTGKACS